MEPFEEKKVNRPLEVLRTLKAQNWQFSKFPGGAVRVEPCSNVTTVLRSVYPFSHLLADSSCYLGILQEVPGQKCEQVKFFLTPKTEKCNKIKGFFSGNILREWRQTITSALSVTLRLCFNTVLCFGALSKMQLHKN